MALPILEPCSIYVHDAHKATGTQLPPRYTKSLEANWLHNQYSVERWLQLTMEHHPWRVANPRTADMYFVSANFSLWCVVRKSFAIRKFWLKIAEVRIPWQ